MAANWIAIARMDAWSLLPVGEAGEPFEVPALRVTPRPFGIRRAGDATTSYGIGTN